MDNILWCTGHQLKIADVAKAEGCYLHDQQGNKYIDLESGVWVVPLGHNHPGVNQAIQDQLGKVTHCGYYNSSPVVDEAALAISDITGLKDGKCIFLCSGSEAVECGIQALHKLSGKYKLLCLHDSFLGSYGSASKNRLMSGTFSTGPNAGLALKQKVATRTATCFHPCLLMSWADLSLNLAALPVW